MVKRIIRVKPYRRKGKKVKGHKRRISKKRIEEAKLKDIINNKENKKKNQVIWEPNINPPNTLSSLKQNIRDKDWHGERRQRLERDIIKLESKQDRLLSEGKTKKALDIANRINEKERLMQESEDIWLM